MEKSKLTGGMPTELRDLMCEPHLKLKELPYQKDKRKYWCKVVLSELDRGATLNNSIHTANLFLTAYDQVFNHG